MRETNGKSCKSSRLCWGIWREMGESSLKQAAGVYVDSKPRLNSCSMSIASPRLENPRGTRLPEKVLTQGPKPSGDNSQAAEGRRTIVCNWPDERNEWEVVQVIETMLGDMNRCRQEIRLLHRHLINSGDSITVRDDDGSFKHGTRLAQASRSARVWAWRVDRRLRRARDEAASWLAFFTMRNVRLQKTVEAAIDERDYARSRLNELDTAYSDVLKIEDKHYRRVIELETRFKELRDVVPDDREAEVTSHSGDTVVIGGNPRRLERAADAGVDD